MRLYGLLTFALKLPSVINNHFVYNRFIVKSSGVFKRNFTVFSAGNCQQWGKNKKHRSVRLQLYFDSMADPQIEETLAPLRASVKEQVCDF